MLLSFSKPCLIEFNYSDLIRIQQQAENLLKLFKNVSLTDENFF